MKAFSISRSRGLMIPLLAAAVCVLAASCSASEAGAGAGASCSTQGVSCAFACVPGVGCPQCDADTDCGPGAPLCALGTCVACRGDSDCGVGQGCAPGDNQCHPLCMKSSDCQDP